ncbi:MAG: hypothetical protein ACI30S_00705 [Muribaculaceae bacterium]
MVKIREMWGGRGVVHMVQRKDRDCDMANRADMYNKPNTLNTLNMADGAIWRIGLVGVVKCRGSCEWLSRRSALNLPLK